MNHSTDIVLGNCQRLKSCIGVARLAYTHACEHLDNDDVRILEMSDYLEDGIWDLYITGCETGLADIVLREWLNSIHWTYLARELYVILGAGEGYNEISS